ncbi:acyl-CoA thioesterase [Amphritea sp.]|uniref:acyl-CoA thioesterase n=1 Tax=Amphritea sp. TaxID=1872502 RepID=UPI003D0F40FB
MFSIEMSVRDYELDMQGIVNNGVYFNYLEHARHEFLTANGISFSALAEAGINLVVIRAELDYKASLKSGDRFRVEVALERVGKARFGFRQQVVRLADEKVCVAGLVVGAALNQRGRPYLPPEFDALFSA